MWLGNKLLFRCPGEDEVLVDKTISTFVAVLNDSG